MAARKTTFEVVRLVDIAPLIAGAALAEAENSQPSRAAGRILSVTYDKSLAITRKLLFASVGLHVSAASSVEQAVQLCGDEKFDLVVIGHSMPLEAKRLLIKQIRGRSDTPFLELQRPGEPRVTEVEYAFDSTQSPALLLEEVMNIIKSHTGPNRIRN